MIADHLDYQSILNEYSLEKNTYEKAIILDRLGNTIKNRSPRRSRCFSFEIQQLKIIASDTDPSLQAKLLNCLYDYVFYSNLDDESLITFYSSIHFHLFGNILCQINEYDLAYHFITRIIESHTTKDYIINKILALFASSLEAEINEKSNIDKTKPYLILLERILLKYGVSTYAEKFLALISSIDYKNTKFERYIEGVIKELKRYQAKIENEPLEAQFSLVNGNGNIYSLLKNFQYAISHPSNISSKCDFTTSIDFIINLLDSKNCDSKLIDLCIETLGKLAFVNISFTNQMKIFNHLAQRIALLDKDSTLLSSTSNCMSLIIYNCHIRLFKDFLTLIYEFKLPRHAISVLVNALIKLVFENSNGKNKDLLKILEEYIKLNKSNDNNICVLPLKNALEARVIALEKTSSPKLTKSPEKVKQQAIRRECQENTDHTEKTPKTVVEKPITKVGQNSHLSIILDLRPYFACIISKDLFTCMFDIERPKYEAISFEASKLWVNYMLRYDTDVIDKIFLKEKLFNPLLIWFYRLLLYSSSKNISISAVVFVLSSLNCISLPHVEIKLSQEQLIYILKILFFVINYKLVDIGSIEEGGLAGILSRCICYSDKFSSFFTTFYIILSDFETNVSIHIAECFESIVTSENSIIGRDEIMYMLEVQADIVPLAKDFRIIEWATKFYKRLVGILENLDKSTPPQVGDKHADLNSTCMVTDVLTTETSSPFFTTTSYSNNHVNVKIDLTSEVRDIFNNINKLYTKSIEDVEHTLNVLKNYTIESNDNFESIYNKVGNIDSVAQTISVSTLATHSLALASVLDSSLSSIQTPTGETFYKYLQNTLRNIAGIGSMETCSGDLLCVALTIKAKYNQLMSKYNTANVTANSAFDRNGAVKLLEGISTRRDLHKLDFRSMQFLTRLYIYLKYKSITDESADIWKRIDLNISLWSVSAIALFIRCVLRDIDTSYKKHNNKPRLPHPLDKHRIEALRWISHLFISKCDNCKPYENDTIDIWRLRNSLQYVESCLVEELIGSTSDDINEYITIIQHLDSSIALDTNLPLDLKSDSVSDSEYNRNDKVEVIKDYYLNKLKLCKF